MVLHTAKLRHRNSILGPQCAEEMSQKDFNGIHDRFQRDSVYRDSQLKIDWTEEKCIEMDKLAQENHSYCPSSVKHEGCKKN